MSRNLPAAVLLAVAFIVRVAAAEAEPDPSPGGNRASADDGPTVLEFSGPIDGSERIEITQAAAIWVNVDRHLPASPMTVNGTPWDPNRRPVLPNEGESRFLSRTVDFSRARLEVIEGRDTVAMTKSADRLLLHLNDTPNGEGHYRFRITFDRPGRPATLRVRATIDGSDVLRITRDEARWEHKYWDMAAGVRLNGKAWNVAADPVLRNSGETAYLPEVVDFETARVIRQSGRDMAVVVPDRDGLTIHFADNPNEADDYEVVIGFGK